MPVTSSRKIGKERGHGPGSAVERVGGQDRVKGEEKCSLQREVPSPCIFDALHDSEIKGYFNTSCSFITFIKRRLPGKARLEFL